MAGAGCDSNAAGALQAVCHISARIRACLLPHTLLLYAYQRADADGDGGGGGGFRQLQAPAALQHTRVDQHAPAVHHAPVDPLLLLPVQGRSNAPPA